MTETFDAPTPGGSAGGGSATGGSAPGGSAAGGSAAEREGASSVPPIVTTQFPPPSAFSVAPTERRGMGLGGVIAIVLGSVTVLGLMVWAIVALLSTFIGVVGEAVGGLPEDLLGGSDSGLEPLMVGEQGSPTAVQPLECEGQCFAEDSLDQLLLDDSAFTALGIEEPDPTWIPSTSYTADDVQRFAREDWVSLEGSPDNCFVLSVFAPVNYAFDPEIVVPSDPIHDLVYRSDVDQYSQMQQSARVFESTAEASSHMASVAEDIDGCPNYQVGTGADLWSADVTASPAHEVPPSVAAVAWVENGPYYRYYSSDIQRGNVIVRTLIGTSEIPEQDIRDFMERVAERLDTLKPTGTVIN